ncbi:nitrate/nitrite transporter NrtS [Photobacterium sp. OFAV2-7]|uniref:nitrate/nitrite transporter NrtS n=1 Tax=Photobacterium sp. OFAV2-7 TaxID=2917748 RepID=UPI001EF5D9DE|nr:nitrate/nitrite transporter NrtS [Photobacterium sp. OFAV2-7]MCG7587804.1 nitrate/nitrite transporter NrtS [Photobacterium sp. OFAV2-7]
MLKKFPIRDALDIAFSPAIVRRSVKVSLLVGTILMIINHGDAILAGELDQFRVMKILLTYIVPYLVSTQAGVAATLEFKQ